MGFTLEEKSFQSMKEYDHPIEGLLPFSNGYDIWFKHDDIEIRLEDLEIIIKQNGETHLP